MVSWEEKEKVMEAAIWVCCFLAISGFSAHGFCLVARRGHILYVESRKKTRGPLLVAHAQKSGPKDVGMGMEDPYSKLKSGSGFGGPHTDVFETGLVVSKIRGSWC